MKCLIVISLALLAPLIAIAQGPDLRPLDELVQQSLKAWDVPGAALVVVHNDHVLWLKGYGRRAIDKPDPVTSDTIFPLASCSKTFTSAAIALLVSQGKLSWDDPVRKHLPEFRLHDKHASELVSIRDLLSHRTGVGGHDFLWYRAPWSQDESVRRLAHLPLDGPFRGSFFYQSIMYMALGRIVDRFHDEKWSGFIRDQFLKPLGMSQTFLTYAEGQKQKDVAAGHRLQSNGKVEVCPWYQQDEPNAAGSICLSAADLGKWLKFQLSGRGTSKRILPLDILNETHQPHVVIPHVGFSKLLNPDTVHLSYGQGWVVQDYRGVHVVQHGGLIDGFRVHLTLLPAHNAAIGILSNLHDRRMPLALSNTLIDFLLRLAPRDWDAYYGELVRQDDKAKEEFEKKREQQRDPNVTPSLAIDGYAGEYEHAAYGICKIKRKEGKLQWEWSSFKHALEHYRGDTFQVRDMYLSDPLIEFIVRDHKVEKLKMFEMEFLRK